MTSVQSGESQNGSASTQKIGISSESGEIVAVVVVAASDSELEERMYAPMSMGKSSYGSDEEIVLGCDSDLTNLSAGANGARSFICVGWGGRQGSGSIGMNREHSQGAWGEELACKSTYQRVAFVILVQVH